MMFAWTASLRRLLPPLHHYRSSIPLSCVISLFSTKATSSPPPSRMPPPLPLVSEDDLRETFIKGRGGPGGQKINKTSSAVQIKHIPSGRVVTCQATRSREQNRKLARNILVRKMDVEMNKENSREAIAREKERKRKANRRKKSNRKYHNQEEADDDKDTIIEISS
eukprot:TRINITY_DN14689_c1_g1_i1.p1 TRINITY_DN14689_c1_g1~~TRINITY_DN14689_c1_g1_i1.p1  ORF type:complete len:166 (-),score=33.67 TRINITY_DN14689_c1_g1_i1:115-612(-)